MSSRSTARRSGACAAAFALVAVGVGAGLSSSPATASSHREAPLTAASPMIDNTDVYAFVSPDKPDTTTIIADWIPFQDPAGGPNFYPWGATGYRYNLKVDNNGDAKPDLTFRFTFKNVDKRGTDTFLYNNGPVMSIDDETLLFKQTYTLEQIDAAGKATTLLADQKVGPSNVGEASMPDYKALRDEAVTPIGGGGGTAFAGQADDPFFLDLRVFDLLYGGKLQETSKNSLSGMNVNTVAVQVPTESLTKGGDGSGIIGLWSTTDQQNVQLGGGRATPTGDFVQVSRLAAPLVNELVLPTGLKDAFNGLPPEKDATVMPVVDRVTDPEVPKLIEKIYGIKAPAAPRDDLVGVFLTGVKGLNQPPKVTPAEMVRLNTTIPPAEGPNRLGVLAKDNQGFPNGRRLFDDVVDIELQALEGAVRTGTIVEALKAGDGVDANDLAFSEAFPYVALPHAGSGPAAAGFASGSTDPAGAGAGSSAPSPEASPGATSPSTSNASSQSDNSGPSTALLIGSVIAAAVVGLAIGLVLSRRRKTSNA